MATPQPWDARARARVSATHDKALPCASPCQLNPVRRPIARPGKLHITAGRLRLRKATPRPCHAPVVCACAFRSPRLGLCPALALGRADPNRCHRCAPSSSCMCHHRCRGPTSPVLHACAEHATLGKAEPFLAQARKCGSLPPSSWWPRPRRDVAGVSCAGPKAIRRTLSRTPHTHPPGAHTHTRTSASRKELRGRHTKSWRRRQAGPSCQREEEDADRRDQAVNESREKKKKKKKWKRRWYAVQKRHRAEPSNGPTSREERNRVASPL